MKVYACSHGSYSDYGIFAMFSTRDAARAAIESMGDHAYGDERIEEWDVFDTVPEPYMVYVKEYYGGNVTERANQHFGWDTSQVFIGRVTRGIGFGKWSNAHGHHYRYWGRDKARVHKAFDDYHAQRLAEQAGVT